MQYPKHVNRHVSGKMGKLTWHPGSKMPALKRRIAANKWRHGLGLANRANKWMRITKRGAWAPKKRESLADIMKRKIVPLPRWKRKIPLYVPANENALWRTRTSKQMAEYAMKEKRSKANQYRKAYNKGYIDSASDKHNPWVSSGWFEERPMITDTRKHLQQYKMKKWDNKAAAYQHNLDQLRTGRKILGKRLYKAGKRLYTKRFIRKGGFWQKFFLNPNNERRTNFGIFKDPYRKPTNPGVYRNRQGRLRGG